VIVLFAADGQQGGGGNNYTILIMLLVLFAAMYFLMIRPQQRRRKQVEQMQSAIGPGDEVVTVAGLYGTVREIDDEKVVLEVAPGVTNTYARAAIGQVVSSAPRPEDTGPSLDKVTDSD